MHSEHIRCMSTTCDLIKAYNTIRTHRRADLLCNKRDNKNPLNQKMENHGYFRENPKGIREESGSIREPDCQ